MGELGDAEELAAARVAVPGGRHVVGGHVQLEDDLVTGHGVGPQLGLAADVRAEGVAMAAEHIELGTLGQVHGFELQAHAVGAR